MLDLRYRSILAVAIPLMASSFIQSVVLLTDSSFLSRYSTLDFDASGNAGLLYVTMFITLVGINDGAQILMARRIGQQKEQRLAKIFGSTIVINLILAFILFGIIQLFIPVALSSYSENLVLAAKQSEFISIRSFGLFFAMITLAINAYFMAIGKTRFVLMGAGITALSNILLDYSLIFGKLGLPEMGLQGAATASTIADGLGMLFLAIILVINPIQKKHELLKNLGAEKKPLVEVFKIGSPIMLQGLIALSVWTIFFIWIEQMGTYELTVSQNIRAIYFLTFVPIWGFGATTKTYISQYIGSNKLEELSIIQRRIQLLTIIFLFVFIHGALFYPDYLISIINPEGAYIKDSSSILRMIFGSILLYGTVSVYFQTINGSGNTRITFLIELAAVIFYFIVSYLLIKVYESHIFWVWIVEYVYFGIIGILSILYLRKANWKTKQI